MNKAIWYSRHTPTHAQLDELKRKGFEIADLESGLELGKLELTNDKQVAKVVLAILSLACDNHATRVYGVFPVPIQEVLDIAALQAFNRGRFVGIPCFASWQFSRTVDNDKPAFDHKKFVRVGDLSRRAIL